MLKNKVYFDSKLKLKKQNKSIIWQCLLFNIIFSYLNQSTVAGVPEKLKDDILILSGCDTNLFEDHYKWKPFKDSAPHELCLSIETGDNTKKSEVPAEANTYEETTNKDKRSLVQMLRERDTGPNAEVFKTNKLQVTVSNMIAIINQQIALIVGDSNPEKIIDKTVSSGDLASYKKLLASLRTINDNQNYKYMDIVLISFKFCQLMDYRWSRALYTPLTAGLKKYHKAHTGCTPWSKASRITVRQADLAGTDQIFRQTVRVLPTDRSSEQTNTTYCYYSYPKNHAAILHDRDIWRHESEPATLDTYGEEYEILRKVVELPELFVFPTFEDIPREEQVRAMLHRNLFFLKLPCSPITYHNDRWVSSFWRYINDVREIFRLRNKQNRDYTDLYAAPVSTAKPFQTTSAIPQHSVAADANPYACDICRAGDKIYPLHINESLMSLLKNNELNTIAFNYIEEKTKALLDDKKAHDALTVIQYMLLNEPRNYCRVLDMEDEMFDTLINDTCARLSTHFPEKTHVTEPLLRTVAGHFKDARNQFLREWTTLVPTKTHKALH